jgi:predicted nucleic acid-binding protein
MALVDTNVLLDLVTDDPEWADWSEARLEEASLAGELLITDVIYAELSARYERIEDLDSMLAEAGIKVIRNSRSSLFLAAKAFQQYRARGGVKTGVLPDFFVGAHAAVEQIPLITRDPKRYRTYFPRVTLIAPDTLE